LDTNTLFTTDGGVTFANGGATPSAMYGLAYDPDHGRIVALPGGGATVSVYSTNGGATWSNGGTVAGSNWFGLCHDPIHKRLVALASDSRQSIYSTDGGSTWVNGGVAPEATEGVRSMIYNPYTGVIYALSTTVLSSENGGLSWTSVASGSSSGNLVAFLYP